MSNNSVTLWIRALESDDEIAAQELFNRYFDRLVALARRKLDAVSRRVVDEEDIAITSLYACLARVSSGQHPQLKDRDHLWRLLVKITEQKVLDAIRKFRAAKRGAGRVRGESVFAVADGQSTSSGINEIPDRQPNDAFVDQLAEQYRRLTDMLDDGLRQVAQLVLAGYSTSEIAEKTNRTQRTVQRRVKMIQQAWKESSQFLDEDAA